jgi:hypothetical protein
MQDNYTDIIIVLDRSGSMAAVARDTIGGFNNFLEDQKRAPGTATLTLNQFDNDFETVYSAADIASVSPLTKDTFQPRGCTALLDAIGRSIQNAGQRLEALPENQRPSKVMFVIITDGEENASHIYNLSKINDMISHQRDRYNWEFVYLGANHDAIASASRMGVATGHTMTYAHNDAGTISSFRSLSKNMSDVRSGTKGDMSWTAEDKVAQARAASSTPSASA